MANYYVHLFSIPLKYLWNNHHNDIPRHQPLILYDVMIKYLCMKSQLSFILIPIDIMSGHIHNDNNGLLIITNMHACTQIIAPQV